MVMCPLTVKESNSAKSTQTRCVRPFVSQRLRRDMQQSRRKEIFGLASTQCVDVSLHVEQLIASVSEAANEGPHDVASLYDDFDFFGDVSDHQ